LVASPEFRDLSPNQIVPILADRGTYIASESTMYRALRQAGLATHRSASRPPRKRPEELVATRPNQIWSWDITYLKSPIRGCFYYLYMAVDVFSRKIVGASVHDRESGTHASALMRTACAATGLPISPDVLHSDNGSVMRGSTLLATLQELGIASSFSRPRVSDDNPFSEALFRTCKYRPDFPAGPFKGLEQARSWVAAFVDWYNEEHRHSGIRFLTPGQRHRGQDHEILAARKATYEAARMRKPHRWSRSTRNWDPIEEVRMHRPLFSRSETA